MSTIRKKLEEKIALAQAKKDQEQIARIEKTMQALSSEILAIVLPDPRSELVSSIRKRTIVSLVDLMLESESEAEWQFFLDFANRVQNTRPAFDLDLGRCREFIQRVAPYGNWS